MRKFEEFLEHPNIYQLEYKTEKIGDGLDNPKDIARSHFKNVSDYVDQLQLNLDEDLRVSIKNIQFLRECINMIDEDQRENLSVITKDVGNKILFIYDNLANAINDQRCVNLHIQTEIASMTKEKNSLRHDVKNVAIEVKKIENFMGVEPDQKFDTMVTQNLY